VGDDNPLWYDYAEPEEPPGRALLALAGLFSVAARVVSPCARLCRLAHDLWCGRTRVRPRGAQGRRHREPGRHGP
jgi:hypothetical protein